MFYDRKVSYLDYCKGGERVKGGGFARTEVYGDRFKLELSLRGIPWGGGNAADVLLAGEGREIILGQVQIEKGCGVFQYQGNLRQDIAGGMDGERLTGLRIPLGEDMQISCDWETGAGRGKNRAVERQEPSRVADRQEASRTTDRQEPSRVAEVRERGKGEEKDTAREATARQGQSRAEEGKSRAAERQGQNRFEERQSRTAEVQEQKRTEERDALRPVKLYEDKWRQLSSIYPHIQPFRDERDYLSVGPADFVLFSAESYRAVNNSFLLHGYYNYRHLILARLERRGETLYYIGVPGNYYDREKQVAVMFGFESFECTEEPARDGDFGYYMMRVEL